MTIEFSTERMFAFVRGFALGSDWSNTVAALHFARAAHRDQTRKGGQPYIVHPLSMACHAIASGIADDAVVATCLLHDVVEDCGLKVSELPVSDDIKESVRRLTHIKGVPLEIYYREIQEDRVASIVKLLDRCDNVSTMAGVFSVKKIFSYIEEIREYVLPLLRTTKEQWPEFGDALFILKYHIGSVIDGLQTCLRAAATQTEGEQ